MYANYRAQKERNVHVRARRSQLTALKLNCIQHAVKNKKGYIDIKKVLGIRMSSKPYTVLIRTASYSAAGSLSVKS
jgi:hypothetical protein